MVSFAWCEMVGHRGVDAVCTCLLPYIADLIFTRESSAND